MARQEELEIEIGPTGEVRVTVKGMPGPACTDQVEVFRKLLGPVKTVELTPEFYEAETGVQVRQHVSRYTE